MDEFVSVLGRLQMMMENLPNEKLQYLDRLLEIKQKTTPMRLSENDTTTRSGRVNETSGRNEI